MELWPLRLSEGLHFHGGAGLARRSLVATAPWIPRELDHGETGKGDPLWGLNPPRTVWAFQGGLGAISRGFGAGPGPHFGARNMVRYWTGTLTPRGGARFI